MADLNWQQRNSVDKPGGRRFYWQAYVNGTKVASIIWNRSSRAYAVEYRGRHICEIGTVQAGKRIVANCHGHETIDTATPRKVKRSELRQGDVISLGWRGPWDHAMVVAIYPDGSPALARPYGIVTGEGTAIDCAVGIERYTLDKGGPDVTLLQRD